MTGGAWDLCTELTGLEWEFTEEEVREIVWGLSADKSLGPDGFFRIFWNTVKDNMLRLMKEVWRGSARLDRLNFSYITLIPKREVPKNIRDYRPITLLNCSFKRVAKVLTNCFVPKLQELGGKEQTGFIVG